MCSKMNSTVKTFRIILDEADSFYSGLISFIMQMRHEDHLKVATIYNM